MYNVNLDTLSQIVGLNFQKEPTTSSFANNHGSEKKMSNEDFDDFDEDLDDDEDDAVISKSPAVASKTPSSSRSKSGGSDISVFFMSTIGPGEKKQKLLINTGNAVGDIKSTVGSIFGVAPDEFHLSHGGVTMDESKYVMDYNVKDGDTVLLIPASTAGKF